MEPSKKFVKKRYRILVIKGFQDVQQRHATHHIPITSLEY